MGIREHEKIDIEAGGGLNSIDLALVMERAYAGRDNLALPSVPAQVSVEEIEQNLRMPAAWSFVARMGKQVVGFAIGYPAIDEGNEELTEFLSLLMVDPDVQGRGIGSSLLDILEEHARQGHRQYIVLWTRQENNMRTQHIYERRGYRRTGDTLNQPSHGPQYQYLLDL